MKRTMKHLLAEGLLDDSDITGAIYLESVLQEEIRNPNSYRKPKTFLGVRLRIDKELSVKPSDHVVARF